MKKITIQATLHFTENFTIFGSNAEKTDYLPEFEIAVH